MKVGLSEVGSNWFKRQAKQFQNSVLPRSFHLRQNFCLPRACIDVKSMSEKKKMKSYLVECLSTRSTLKKTVQKKSLKKNRWKKPLKKKQFFFMKKTARLEKKTDHSTSEMKKPFFQYKKWLLGGKYWRSLSIEKLTFLIKWLFCWKVWKSHYQW